MATPRNRRPEGTPSGGEFAPDRKQEAGGTDALAAEAEGDPAADLAAVVDKVANQLLDIQRERSTHAPDPGLQMAMEGDRTPSVQDLGEAMDREVEWNTMSMPLMDATRQNIKLNRMMEEVYDAEERAEAADESSPAVQAPPKHPGDWSDADWAQAAMNDTNAAVASSQHRDGTWDDALQERAVTQIADAMYEMQDGRVAYESFCDDHDLPMDMERYHEIAEAAHQIGKAREEAEGVPDYARIFK